MLSLSSIAPGTSLPEMLSLQFQQCTTGNVVATGTVAPLTSTYSCQPYASSPGSMASGTMTATYGTLGSTISVIGGGTNPSGGSPGVLVDTYFVDNLKIGGLPAGTPVDLTFVFTYSGTWSYSLPSYLTAPESISINPNISVSNGQGIISDSVNTLTFCDPNTVSGSPCSTNAFACSSSNQQCSPSPTFSNTVDSELVKTTSGSTLGAVVQLINSSSGVYFESTLSDDFLDPGTLSFLATDPATGLPLQGVTVTGDSGTNYAVNPVSSVPEPLASRFMLLGVACLATKAVSRRRFRRE